jgi:D-sedoheptulose 7-phosphate isomerase/D-glycero-D-manno-heptose 1,7-bisphosphate phosphatase
MFADPGDVLVVVSSSGNSPNILSALRTAKASNMKTIALVGFDGGEAKDLADIVLHVPVNNYGIVEDAHQAIMHVIAQHIRITNKDKDTIKL